MVFLGIQVDSQDISDREISEGTAKVPKKSMSNKIIEAMFNKD